VHRNNILIQKSQQDAHVTMKISSRNKAQVNKTHYFS